MADFSEQDLLDEIRFDIKAKDLMKGQLVLAALKYVGRDTQKKALFEVSRADAEFSIPLLVGLFVNSPEIANAFPQLNETMYSKILSRPDVLQHLLLKEADPAFRAFLAEVAGRIRLADAAPVLMDIVGSKTDSAVARAAIISLGMIGSPGAVPLIHEVFGRAENGLADAAAEALGEIGTPEAAQCLAQGLTKNPELDIKIIDILSRMQIPEAVELLNQTLSSEDAHIRTAGKRKLGAIGLMGLRVLMNNLSRPDPDLVIHSLNVLGDIGDLAAVAPIRSLLHNEPEDPNVRFAAYEALGRLPMEKGAYALAAGLEDPVDNVRAAAARAIDRNYNALLAGGVRNMIRSGDATAVLIMETIINAQCDRIFLDLLEEDYFKTEVLSYLSKKAHPDVRSYYAGKLSNNGHADLARQLTSKPRKKAKTALRVYTVDDSKMLLNIYRTVLYNLGCEAIAFEFPAEAVARVRKDRPDVILTDLNMPVLTGIDLTEKIRQWFSKDELPIIMVTTQQESQEFQSALEKGLNGIVHKPFTEAHIAAALKKYAGFDTARSK